MINVQLDLYILRIKNNQIEVLLDNQDLPSQELNDKFEMDYQLGLLSKRYLPIDDRYLNFRNVDLSIFEKKLHISYMVLIYNTMIPKQGEFYLLENIADEHNTTTLHKIKNII